MSGSTTITDNLYSSFIRHKLGNSFCWKSNPKSTQPHLEWLSELQKSMNYTLAESYHLQCRLNSVQRVLKLNAIMILQ